MSLFKIAFVGLIFISTSLLNLANAGLVFFTDRANFEAASGLVAINETFESANVAAGGIVSTPSMLNSETNNSVFSTGSIAPGLSIAASNGNLVVLNGILGDSKSVAADLFAAFTIINLDAGSQALGLDIFANAPNAILDLRFYDVDARLFATTSISGINNLSPSFFGVISDSTLIAKVEFEGLGSVGEVIDNITFGQVVNVPEPSTFAIFVIGILGLLVRQANK